MAGKLSATKLKSVREFEDKSLHSSSDPESGSSPWSAFLKVRSTTLSSSCSSPTRSKGPAPAVSLLSAGWKTHSVAVDEKASRHKADCPDDSVTQLVSFTQLIELADDWPTTTQAALLPQPPLQLVVSVLSVPLLVVAPELEELAAAARSSVATSASVLPRMCSPDRSG
ncbi:unnamed protein product [Phytophthora lilii]|uniref:Unnamed protein product n=1 Tax=Phytophthora lilii TaxID=2077276 RepID=A0A9W6TGX4_9STRA|nr:unnamed protein product [Phytophthora lilii]